MTPNQDSSALLSLPDEIILMILNRVQRSHDLRSVTRTCQRLYSLCDPILYYRVVLDDLQRTKSFMFALRAQPGRAKNVHTLWTYASQPLTNKWSNDSMDGYLETSPLTFDEAIDCVDDIIISNNIKFIDGIIVPTLPALVNCRLEFHHDEYWPASTAWTVFLHPTIKQLTLTMADLNLPILRNTSSTQLRSRFGSTPLEKLALKSCLIAPADLRAIVAFPSALKRLFLRDSPPSARCWRIAPATWRWIEALAAIHKTLEILSIQRCEAATASDFLVLRDFSALRYLSIAVDQLLGNHGLLLCAQEADLDMEKILPPNIDILELHLIEWRDVPASMHLLSQILSLRMAGEVVRRLRIVEVVGTSLDAVNLRSFSEDADTLSKPPVQELQDKFYEAGIAIVIIGGWCRWGFGHVDHLRNQYPFS